MLKTCFIHSAELFCRIVEYNNLAVFTITCCLYCRIVVLSL